MTSAALRPHALPPRTLTRLTPADCTATQRSTAQEKASAGNRVLAFIENGLHQDAFTDDLYRTCSQHLFAHIAHFDRLGFADVWFTTPEDKAAFIRHAMNASSLGDPAWTWSDVEQHIQRTLADHPHLQEPSAWTGATRPHACPSCHCAPPDTQLTPRIRFTGPGPALTVPGPRHVRSPTSNRSPPPHPAAPPPPGPLGPPRRPGRAVAAVAAHLAMVSTGPGER